jgi:hypothetical protein
VTPPAAHFHNFRPDKLQGNPTPLPELHIADDDLELYVMLKLPASLNATVQAHIEACHSCAIRAVEQARAVWEIRDVLAPKPIVLRMKKR